LAAAEDRDDRVLGLVVVARSAHAVLIVDGGRGVPPRYNSGFATASSPK
jgi:hypothetical protein